MWGSRMVLQRQVKMWSLIMTVLSLKHWEAKFFGDFLLQTKKKKKKIWTRATYCDAIYTPPRVLLEEKEDKDVHILSCFY